MNDIKLNLNKLRGSRVEKGLSQKEMAEVTGIGYSSYQRIENDEKKVSLVEAKKIAEVLGKDINEIFFT